MSVELLKLKLLLDGEYRALMMYGDALKKRIDYEKELRSSGVDVGDSSWMYHAEAERHRRNMI